MRNTELEYREKLVEIKQYQDYKDPAIEKFLKTEQERLGIIGGCISILSKSKEKPILLYSPDVQSKFIKDDDDQSNFIKDFILINSEYEASCVRFPEYIDLLFLISRKSSCPEFVKSIPFPKQNLFEYPFQYQLRKKYEILHCSSGEILFFSLLWRLVLELLVRKEDLSIVELENDKTRQEIWHKKKEYTKEREITFRFPDEEKQFESIILEKIEEAKANSTKDQIFKNISTADKEFRDCLLKNELTLVEIYEQLGLGNEDHVKELNKYLSFIFDEKTLELQFLPKEIQLQEFSINMILKLCKKLNNAGIQGKINKLSDLLISLHDTARFPILPYYFLMFFDEKRKLKEHIVFPIWYTFSNETIYEYNKTEKEKEKEKEKESAVLHALYTIKPIWEMYGEDQSCCWYTENANIGNGIGSQKFNDYLSKIYAFFSSFCKPIIDKEYYAKEFERRQKLIKMQSTRAAISQVMARNLSHNIGSHVFTNLIGNTIYSELDQKIKFKGEPPYKPLSPGKEENNNYQLAYFNQYLKSRMDYLSEVTFGVSKILTTKRIYNDVLGEFDRVRLLLNHISGISNFKFEFKLKYNGEDLTEEKDISAAFPSDILGCQAFYNIIENIIRNTAKHAKNTDPESVKTFTIQVKDIEQDKQDNMPTDYLQYYCVEIDDGIAIQGKKIRTTQSKNLTKFINEKWTESDNNEKIIFTSENEIEEIDWLIANQNCRLNDSVLDEKENKLRNHSLGLLEMEASAAFLRQIDIPEIESEKYDVENGGNDIYVNSKKEFNIIKAIKTNNNALGYRFFIKKPQELLFVGEWSVTDSLKKELMNQGIWFITPDEFMKSMTADKAYSHQFVIYQSNINHKDAKQILDFTERADDDLKFQTLLPLRRVVVEKENIPTITEIFQQNINDTEILHQLKEKMWCHYFEDNIKIDCDNIDIRKHVNTSSIKHQVIFLDHADKCSFDDDNNNQYRNGKDVWIENLSSNSRSKLPNFQKLSISTKETEPIKVYLENIKNDTQTKLEIFEAYHNKVIVIDERVQKFAESNTEGNTPQISTKELFRSTNVHIPDIPLDPVSFSEENTGKILQYINDNIEGAFLLIHYGILERLCLDIKKRNDNLNNWAVKGKKIVVTSGRGQHSLDLPQSVCYINLSSMLHAFVENRNKYSINYLLNQSRRKNG